MSPEKLKQALEARAKRKLLAAQKKQQKQEQCSLSLVERFILWAGEPVVQKCDALRMKLWYPKLYSASQVIKQFNHVVDKIEKKVLKCKEPDSLSISTVVTLIPMIASIPLAHPQLEREAQESLTRLGELSKKMTGQMAAILQSMLCILSLVDEKIPIANSEDIAALQAQEGI